MFRGGGCGKPDLSLESVRTSQCGPTAHHDVSGVSGYLGAARHARERENERTRERENERTRERENERTRESDEACAWREKQERQKRLSQPGLNWRPCG